MTIKQLIKRLAPPILVDAGRALRDRDGKNHRPEWEYVPEGWRVVDPRIKGWNQATVVETLLRQWPEYVEALRGPAAIRGYYGVSTGPVSYVAHNVFMTFGYVVALAASKREHLSILDWGGGLGHYYVLAKALLPEVTIDYSCRELPLICEAGRKLLPEVRFFDDDSCTAQKYDLVLASSVLQYREDWQSALAKMISVADYLYLTRLPVVEESPSFVGVQRSYANGYRTEYLGWFFNRRALLDCLEASSMHLIREFHIEPHPDVLNAPAPCNHRGFLARRGHRVDGSLPRVPKES
jgi:putative methyltransferase (TIGR04325 family)